MREFYSMLSLPSELLKSTYEMRLAALLQKTVSFVSASNMITPSSSSFSTYSLPALKISASMKIIPTLVMVTWQIHRQRA